MEIYINYFKTCINFNILCSLIASNALMHTEFKSILDSEFLNAQLYREHFTIVKQNP